QCPAAGTLVPPEPAAGADAAAGGQRTEHPGLAGGQRFCATALAGLCGTDSISVGNPPQPLSRCRRRLWLPHGRTVAAAAPGLDRQFRRGTRGDAHAVLLAANGALRLAGATDDV